MKSIVLIVVLISLTLISRSQNLIIDDTIYKSGIYKEYEEFKYNNPSVDLQYDIVTKEKVYGHGIIGGRGKLTLYQLVIEKKEGRSIGRVFGFCDGKNVYVNENYPKLGPKTQFSKIEYMGSVCYYESTYTAPAYNGTMPAGTVNYLDEMIIDIAYDAIVPLSKGILIDIIADDKELLNQFNKETRKNKKLKEYLIRYLERN